MKHYTVKIKEVYIYESVPANNKKEAEERVMRTDGWNECDNQLEVTVEREEV